MNQHPLVSVIVIFFNMEQFLQEAIESIFAQTYDRWELFLVDDGSSDRSSEIAKGYTASYPGQVHYIEHPEHRNCGMSASRNLGLQYAAGEYIAFLDADDVWLPQKLEQQAELLENCPEAAMVYGPTQWWYSWTGKPEDRPLDYIHELGVKPDTLLQPPALLVQFLNKEGISPCTCSVLLRREAVERVGGFEEDFRGLYEDQAFFAKLCLHAPVFASAECLARYRQHANSNCSITQETGQYTAARPAFLDWLASYLKQQGIKDKEVWKALQVEMRPYRYPHLHRLIQILRQGLPGEIYRKLLRVWLHRWGLPILRQLRTLQFRRLRPIGDGRQYGTPIVRHYWDHFLDKNRLDIRGKALEIGTTATILKWGGQAVTQVEAIDLKVYSPEITIAADLSRADLVPSNTYDCFINQFTMHLIYDVEAALYHAVRMLKPGGVLLVNFPCLDYYFPAGLDMGTGAPLFLYWWFTPILVESLLRRINLSQSDYQIEVYGNLFARIAYQLNLPAEELTQHELNFVDPGHPLLICARIVKPFNWQASKPDYHSPWRPEVTPTHWDPVTGHYAY